MAYRYASALRRGGLALFLAAGLGACGGSHSGEPATSGASPPSPAATAARGDLVSGTAIASQTSAELNTLFKLAGFSSLGPFQYGVTTYRFVYKTITPAGVLVDASGLLAVPAKTPSTTSPLLSLQHGTIFRDADRPSAAGLTEYYLGVLFATFGYVVAMPDYLGYGNSAGMVHPYVHANSLATATVDLLRASKTWMQTAGQTHNGQVFLAGYSEGGYATLATQREMETSLATEFTVTASVAGAGPYDMSATARGLLSGNTLAVPAYVGFVFKAYDTYYNAPSQLGSYFQSSYVPVVDSYFDGTHAGLAINAALGGTNVGTSNLFLPSFLSSFLGSGEAALKARLAENDIYDWRPTAPTVLFHGPQDDVVPYANTTTAYTTMQTRGSTSVARVDCTGVSPTNHTNCAAPFVSTVKSTLASYANNLQ